MMQRRPGYRIPSAVLAGLLLTGCAVRYAAVGGAMSFPEYGFAVTAPQGWYQATGPVELFLITRDGRWLQFIGVQRMEIDKDLKFTKRKFDSKMPPPEVAEVELDNERSEPG